MVETLQHKFLLPSGKGMTVLDVMKFCYSLSETEVLVLIALTGPKTVEDLEQELKLSKAAVTRSLNKLLELDLVKRTKETGNRPGRPRYIYLRQNELLNKIMNDVEICAKNMVELTKSQLLSGLTGIETGTALS